MKLIDKDALVAEIDRQIELLKPFLGACAGQIVAEANDKLSVLEELKNFLDTLEVKEVDLGKEIDNWKVVDDTYLPQVDRTKIYCVFTKQRYILAKVINHPQDDGLLQWKCTEFPFHRYDMCEGDKYMQIV